MDFGALEKISPVNHYTINRFADKGLNGLLFFSGLKRVNNIKTR
jgi:hypothetical protein